MRLSRRWCAPVLNVAVATTAIAQGSSPVGPPIRKLGPTIVESPVTFSAVSHLRELSDGRVLVNDGNARTLQMLDSRLANPRMLLDSAAGKPNSYGSRAGGLIAYRADSTLMVDAVATSLIVLGPNGESVRVMSIPFLDVNTINQLVNGRPGIDASGRLVYRVFAERAGTPSAAAAGGSGGRGGLRGGAGGGDGLAPPVAAPDPDTSFIVAASFAARTLDTLGAFKIRPGRLTGPATGTLFPPIDDWTLLADGTLAVLRGQDYHIDWRAPDGRWTSSPRIPFPWKRLSDDDKRHVADSLTAVRDSSVARLPAGARPMFDGFGMMSGYSAPARGTVPTAPLPRVQTPPPISASVIPDYLPAFTRASMRADVDGRIWIQQGGPSQATPLAPGLYDVVNRDGVLTDRVELPTGYAIAGFGAGGSVYLSYRDAGISHLVKARFK